MHPLATGHRRFLGSARAINPALVRARNLRQTAPALRRGALVATATLLVAGCPVAVVCWLRATGTVSSLYVAMILAMAVSLGASWVGRALWEKRAHSDDLLFNELLLWGFLHRLYTQRKLARALEVLGAGDAAAGAAAPPRSRGQTRLLGASWRRSRRAIPTCTDTRAGSRATAR